MNWASVFTRSISASNASTTTVFTLTPRPARDGVNLLGKIFGHADRCYLLRHAIMIASYYRCSTERITVDLVAVRATRARRAQRSGPVGIAGVGDRS